MKTQQKLYLDYFNNFSSVQGFADHYNFELNKAQKIIDQGRIEHENHVKSLYPKKTMTGPFNVKIEQSKYEKELPDVYVSNEQGFHLCKVYTSEMQFIPDGSKLQAEKIARVMNCHDELIYVLNDLHDMMPYGKKHHSNCAQVIDGELGCNCGVFEKINKIENLLKRAKGEL